VPRYLKGNEAFFLMRHILTPKRAEKNVAEIFPAHTQGENTKNYGGLFIFLLTAATFMVL
jgi:hypothetical protein